METNLPLLLFQIKPNLKSLIFPAYTD